MKAHGDLCTTPIIQQACGAWAHFSVLEVARDWLWVIRVLSVVRFEV